MRPVYAPRARIWPRTSLAAAGGLSLGLEAAGYRVVLSADHDAEAVETHRHHFGGLALDWDLGDADRVTEIARLCRPPGWNCWPAARRASRSPRLAGARSGTVSVTACGIPGTSARTCGVRSWR